jgi:hypothetical protein
MAVLKPPQQSLSFGGRQGRAFVRAVKAADALHRHGGNTASDRDDYRVIILLTFFKFRFRLVQLPCIGVIVSRE